MSRSFWTIVLCAGSIMGIAVGTRQGLGLFMTPISIDLGLGRETYALALGLMNLLWGLTSPVFGALSDRYGAGLIAAAGGLLYATGLAVMTLSGDGNQLLIGGTLIGLGLGGTGFSVLLGMASRAVAPEKRGAALGLVSMGGSIGQFLALPYTHFLLKGHGWSTSLLILAATALLMLPLVRGVSGRFAADDGSENQTMGEALRNAGSDRSFWLLNAGFFVCGFHLAFVLVHLPAYLDDLGFDTWVGATGLTLIGLCNIVGSYFCGVLGDWYSRKNLLSLLYVIRAGAFTLFLVMPPTVPTVMLFCCILGFLWLGTLPLTSGLVATMYGTKYMATLFGIVFVGHQLGGFLGAWLAGFIFDLYQSYDAMWWLSIALGLLSALLHWPIKEVRGPKTANA